MQIYKRASDCVCLAAGLRLRKHAKARKISGNSWWHQQSATSDKRKLLIYYLEKRYAVRVCVCMWHVARQVLAICVRHKVYALSCCRTFYCYITATQRLGKQ